MRTPRIERKLIHNYGQGRAGKRTQDCLIAAGFRRFTANDPQAIDEETAALPCYHTRDIGKHKVTARAEQLRQFERVTYQGIAEPNESPLIDLLVEQADILVCSVNTVSGRRTGAAKAQRYQKPLFDIGIADARHALGGVIRVWLPENDWGSCPGCWLDKDLAVPRGEVLPGSVVGYVAAVAAQLIVQYLSGAAIVRDNTLFVVNAATHEIEKYAVAKNPECLVCGAAAAER